MLYCSLLDLEEKGNIIHTTTRHTNSTKMCSRERCQHNTDNQIYLQRKCHRKKMEKTALL